MQFDIELIQHEYFCKCNFLKIIAISKWSGYVLSRTALLLLKDRNEDFEGGQVESTFSRGRCDITSGTISKILVLNERYGYYLSIDTP